LRPRDTAADPQGEAGIHLALLRNLQAGADAAAQRYQRSLLGEYLPATSIRNMLGKGWKIISKERRWPCLGVLLLFAALVPVTVLLFETYAHFGRSIWVLGGYVAAPILGFSVYHFIVERGEWQNRFQDYRALAEGMRVQIFWASSALPSAVSDHYLRLQRDETRLGAIRVAGPRVVGSGACAGTAGAMPGLGERVLDRRPMPLLPRRRPQPRARGAERNVVAPVNILVASVHRLRPRPVCALAGVGDRPTRRLGVVAAALSGSRAGLAAAARGPLPAVSPLRSLFPGNHVPMRRTCSPITRWGHLRQGERRCQRCPAPPTRRSTKRWCSTSAARRWRRMPPGYRTTGIGASSTTSQAEAVGVADVRRSHTVPRA